MKKQKEELKPSAIEHNEYNIDFEHLESLKKSMEKLNIDIKPEKESDTFYKLAIEKLFDGENIETKTEFLHPAEVFSATKLQFLGDYADIPMLSDFISAFERKRISLNRKGREEIILALQERRQEEIELRKAEISGGIIKS